MQANSSRLRYQRSRYGTFRAVFQINEMHTHTRTHQRDRVCYKRVCTTLQTTFFDRTVHRPVDKCLFHFARIYIYLLDQSFQMM